MTLTPEQIEALSVKTEASRRAAAERAFNAASLVDGDPYLEQCGIHPQTYNDPKFQGTWRRNAEGDLLFPHRDEKGITGIDVRRAKEDPHVIYHMREIYDEDGYPSDCETYRRTYTGVSAALARAAQQQPITRGSTWTGCNAEDTRFSKYSPDTTKALWHSRPSPHERILVITETPMAAMSYHQLSAPPGTPFSKDLMRYASVSSDRMDPKQIELIEKALRQLPSPSLCVAAVGCREHGDALWAQIASLHSKMPGVRFIRDSPVERHFGDHIGPPRDWNESLRLDRLQQTHPHLVKSHPPLDHLRPRMDMGR